MRVEERAYVALLVVGVVAVTVLMVQVGASNDGKFDAANDDGCICHGAGDPDPGVAVDATTDVPDAGYIPGETYAIDVSVSCGSSNDCKTPNPTFLNEGGFNLEVSAGSLPDPSGDDYQVNDDGATHKEEGNDQRSWTVTWTAPDRGTGDVRVYLAANAVDGNDSPNEDDRWNFVDNEDHDVAGDVPEEDKYFLIAEGRPPTPPQSPAVAVDGDRLEVTWSPPSDTRGFDLVRYVLYRRAPDDSDFVEQARVPAGTTAYKDTGLERNVTYTYQVSAVTEYGEGDPSKAVQGALPVVAPTAPRNLEAQAGSGVVSLSWSSPADVGGGTILEYRIYRGQGGGTPSELDTTSGTTFTDDTVIDDETYTYEVAAINEAGEGARAGPVEATPAATKDAAPVVEITAPAEGAEVALSFEVRGTASDAEDQLQSVEVRLDGGDWQAADGTASWSVTLTTAAGDHLVQARARDPGQASGIASVNVTAVEDGSGGDGGQDDGTDGSTNTSGGQVQPPSGLAVRSVEAGFELTWDAVPGAEGYEVQRSLGGPFTTLDTTTGTTYLDDRPVTGSLHRYRVAALGGNASAVSDPVEASTAGGDGTPSADSSVLALVVVSAAITGVVLAVLHRYR